MTNDEPKRPSPAEAASWLPVIVGLSFRQRPDLRDEILPLIEARMKIFEEVPEQFGLDAEKVLKLRQAFERMRRFATIEEC